MNSSVSVSDRLCHAYAREYMLTHKHSDSVQFNIMYVMRICIVNDINHLAKELMALIIICTDMALFMGGGVRVQALARVSTVITFSINLIIFCTVPRKNLGGAGGKKTLFPLETLLPTHTKYHNSNPLDNLTGRLCPR